MSQELVDSVNTLTSKTTQLLNEYVNAKTTIDSKVASAKADAATASQKAEQSSADALSSAGAASRAEAAAQQAEQVSGLDTVDQAVKSALDDSYQYAMTKAEFDALRTERKRKYAGSGFVEWGKHFTGAPHINEGLWVYDNKLNLGRDHAKDQLGVSRTTYPIALVDGVECCLLNVGTPHTVNINDLKFAPAEDGTRTYDSATGLVKQHTSSGEAFEGFIHNGDFRNGDASWILRDGGNFSIIDGIATLECENPASSDRIEQGLTGRITETGTYTFEASVKVNAEAKLRVQLYKSSGSKYLESFETDGFKTFKADIEINDTSESMYFQVQSIGIAGSTIEIASTRFRKKTEDVITSRKDLFFVEVWHELVSEKGIVVPYGNTQYGRTVYKSGIECTSLATYGIDQGYCAYGQWDRETVGYGNKWSLLTDAQKKIYLNDPRNNLYFDDEAGELIQVRYRMRVVRGYGNDFHQKNIRQGLNGVLGYGGPNNYRNRVHSQAGRQVSRDYDEDSSSYGFFSAGNTYTNSKYKGDIGIFANAVDHCFALPIALVQRLSQGAYHPTLCPEGCNGWRKGDGDTNSYPWYHIDASLAKTQLDCYKGLPSGSQEGGGGDWGGGIGNSPKRHDQYKYHNAIYVGQIQDLRLNANKLDTSRLLEDSIYKAITGDMRGKGRVPFTSVRKGVKPDSSGSNLYIGKGSTLAPNLWGHDDYAVSSHNQRSIKIPSCAIRVTATNGSNLNPKIALGQWYVCKAVRNGGYGLNLRTAWFAYPDFVGENQSFRWIDGGNTDTLDVDIIVAEDLLSEEYDSLPYATVFGSPERVAATFENGVIGQWSPGPIPNGESQQYPLSRKADVSASTLSRLLTQNDGLTWAVDALPFDNIRNEVTSAAPESTVWLHFYPVKSEFTEPQFNYPIIGELGKVVDTSQHSVGYGNRLLPSLIGKVGTSIERGSAPHWQAVTGGFYFASTKRLLGDGKGSPVHAPLTMPAPSNLGPAVKALYSLTERNGLLYLQLHGSELKYDYGEVKTLRADTVFTAKKSEVYQFFGFNNSAFNRVFQFLKDVTFTWGADTYNGFTINQDGRVINVSGQITSEIMAFNGDGWGDDQTTPIVSQEGFKTDLNGNTVKTFCHHSQIPLGIANDNDTNK